MRVIFLTTFWTIILDIIAWAVIQPLVGWLAMRFPDAWLNPGSWLFRTRDCEQGGQIYQSLFRVRAYKDSLPYGGSLFQDEFTMKELGEINETNLLRWLKETCRSELTHWFAIMPSALFFLWNPWYIGIFMVVYALLFNFPLVFIQRYNRPRIQNMLKIIQSRKS
jgi:glycosyl-4,4'-diaponeurosporenoate acyltransferase